MSLFLQIFLGSLFLGLCSLIHILILVATIIILRRVGPLIPHNHLGLHWGVLTSVAFVLVVIAHTIQVWIWAIAFVSFEALPTVSDAIYFSLVTYTTVGYGDVTVGHDFRVFAAMAAVTGLLNFGLSTAFLVGLLTRFIPADID